MSRPVFHALAFGPQGGMAAKHGAEAATVSLSFDDLPGGIKATGRLEAGEPWARIELARDGQAAVLYDGPWSALPLPAGLSVAASPKGAPARGAAFRVGDIVKRATEIDPTGTVEDVQAIEAPNSTRYLYAVRWENGEKGYGYHGDSWRLWHRPPAPPPAPPAGPASPLPAAEIGPQAGGQGPESPALAFVGSLEGPGIVVREIFGGWRWREREASLNIFTPEDWSLPYATEGAARAGAREAVAAAFRLRAAEAKAAELAVEVERLAALAEIHAEDAEDWNLPATARASKARAAAAHALLARLGFRPGQP